jgi:hypothetical protein
VTAMNEINDVGQVVDPTSSSRSRFRNVRLCVVCCLIGLTAGAAAIVSYPRPPAFIFGLISLYALTNAINHLAGVVIRETHISAPRAIAKWAPAIAIWRATIPTSSLTDVTALGRHLGNECVGLSTMDGQIPVLFANREDRLAFFARLREHDPNVKIYRAY